MLQCTVKFCGGCNPRYDRGDAYRTIREALSSEAVFSYPEDGVSYDVLLIIRGCTGCPYLYEDINARHRVVLTEESGIPTALRDIQIICRETAGEECQNEES